MVFMIAQDEPYSRYYSLWPSQDKTIQHNGDDNNDDREITYKSLSYTLPHLLER